MHTRAATIDTVTDDNTGTTHAHIIYTDRLDKWEGHPGRTHTNITHTSRARLARLIKEYGHFHREYNNEPYNTRATIDRIKFPSPKGD